MDDTDYFDKITDIGTFYDIFIKCRACVLLLAILKWMKYLSMNSRTVFLVNTVKTAWNDLKYYYILVGTITFGFTVMNHIAFGNTIERFSSYKLATLYSLQMFFGSLDYYEMEEADSAMASIFFTIFMFLVMFILINIFIAILVRAYEKIKEKNKSNLEKHISCWSAILAYIVNKVKNVAATP